MGSASVVVRQPVGALGAASGSRRVLWGLACALIGVTFAVYFVQIPSVRQSVQVSGEFLVTSEPYFLDRALAALAILLKAAILQGWMQSLRIVGARDRALEGNLVSNAVKFTESGSVTLASRVEQDRSVIVTVADTGCGIQPENLERIFGDFMQEDDAPVQMGSGWGLGLAISRRMATLLGGELSVQSRLQEASTFTVRLQSTALAARDGQSTDRP